MKTHLILAAPAALLASILFVGTPAFAQDVAVGSSQIVVSYSDLDLSTQRGVRQLDRRIRTAVETACGPTSDSDPAGKNDVRECRADTLAQARAQREVAIAQFRQAGPQIASGR